MIKVNIFEQYGIKEVANCTLYAIDLDKYDNEIYIPIMYLDTLKVSTIEQSAEQVTARGGSGNPKLIAWDYGKDITVTLEDALYTPASQSLMWGGKFGVKPTKIYGVWNPYEYPLDKTGQPIYLVKEIAVSNEYNKVQSRHGIFYPINYNHDTKYPTGNEGIYSVYDSDGKELREMTSNEITIENKWKPFICCQDNRLKYYRFVLNDAAKYRYNYLQDSSKQDEMPQKQLKNLERRYIYEEGSPVYGYSVNSLIEDNSWPVTGRPEIAELIIDRYGDFSYDYYNGKDEVLTIITEQKEEAPIEITNYTKTDLINPLYQNSIGYKWFNVDMKMISLEGSRQVHYLNNVSYEFKTPLKRSNKIVTIAQQELYKTAIGRDGVWTTIGEPLTEEVNLKDREGADSEGYGYKLGEYSSKVDFYSIITYKDSISKQEYKVRVKVGTFYIIADWNIDEELPHDSIWPIEEGFDRMRLIERVEKCVASRTFAIDTDINLQHANYRNMKEYEQSPLTIYINPRSMKPYHPNSDTYRRADGVELFGNYRIIKEGEVYYKWTRTKAPIYTTIGHSITVDSKSFPGTYRLVGETYTRNRTTGRDEHYQFEIPLAKMSTENSLNLVADGEPTTFTMKLTALRRDDGAMMKLTTYTTDCNYYGDYCSGSTKVIPTDSIEDPALETLYYFDEIDRLKILYPDEGESYEVSIDNQEQLIKPIVGLEVSTRAKTISFDKTTLGQYSVSVEEEQETEILEPGEDYTIDIANNREEATE